MLSSDSAVLYAKCVILGRPEGFLAIMLNFNNERMSMAVGACRMSRCCLEDAIRPWDILLVAKICQDHRDGSIVVRRFEHVLMRTNPCILSGMGIAYEKPGQGKGALVPPNLTSKKVTFEFSSKKASIFCIFLALILVDQTRRRLSMPVLSCCVMSGCFPSPWSWTRWTSCIQYNLLWNNEL